MPTSCTNRSVCNTTCIACFFFLFLYCRQSNIKWDTELLANYHPSYYGMMVAKFLPIRATNSSRQGEL